jgi:hypothetical protein
MALIYHVSTVLSVLVFLYFGVSCLFAGGMREDFDRFGLRHLRLLTGTLELLGAIGLMVGQFVPALVIVSAGGLALLMALGIAARVRQRDSSWQIAPAGMLMLLNGYVAWYAADVRRG